MLCVSCTAVQPQKNTKYQPFPLFVRCHKPVFTLRTNQDLLYALEQTEHERAQCAAQVETAVKVQEMNHEKATKP